MHIDQEDLNFKLICMNEGYSTYWDAAAGVFKLQAN